MLNEEETEKVKGKEKDVFVCFLSLSIAVKYEVRNIQVRKGKREKENKRGWRRVEAKTFRSKEGK